MVIKKKIWKDYFDDVASGKKKFELRLNNFNVTEGDCLLLEEWDQEKQEYTGRTIEKQVTYVLQFKVDELPFWPSKDVQEKGLQIISIE